MYSANVLLKNEEKESGTARQQRPRTGAKPVGPSSSRDQTDVNGRAHINLPFLPLRALVIPPRSQGPSSPPIHSHALLERLLTCEKRPFFPRNRNLKTSPFYCSVLRKWWKLQDPFARVVPGTSIVLQYGVDPRSDVCSEAECMACLEAANDERKGERPPCLRRQPLATDTGNYPVCAANLGIRLREEYEGWLEMDWISGGKRRKEWEVRHGESKHDYYSLTSRTPDPNTPLSWPGPASPQLAYINKYEEEEEEEEEEEDGAYVSGSAQEAGTFKVTVSGPGEMGVLTGMVKWRRCDSKNDEEVRKRKQGPDVLNFGPHTSRPTTTGPNAPVFVVPSPHRPSNPPSLIRSSLAVNNLNPSGPPIYKFPILGVPTHTAIRPPFALRLSRLSAFSLWKEKVLRWKKKRTTRGVRYYGYPPSMLNPVWEDWEEVW